MNIYSAYISKHIIFCFFWYLADKSLDIFIYKKKIWQKNNVKKMV